MKSPFATVGVWILHTADLHNNIRFGGGDAFSYFDNCKQKKSLH
jgi:hypothetical protein